MDHNFFVLIEKGKISTQIIEKNPISKKVHILKEKETVEIEKARKSLCK